nr:very short patch repair endonuclease [Amycolatopsis taiwanensis]
MDSSPPDTNRRQRDDVLLRRARIAVFMDGCYWHLCPEHADLPRSNHEWWRRKLEGIVRRDRGYRS